VRISPAIIVEKSISKAILAVVGPPMFANHPLQSRRTVAGAPGHCAVLDLHQAVVAAFTGPALGLFDAESFKQLGDGFFDKLAAVVQSPARCGILNFNP
jgi:hypothetical protein